MDFIYFKDIKESLCNVPNLDQIKNKTIFISGATGLVCSSIVDFIAIANIEYGLNTAIYCGCRSKEKYNSRFSGFDKKADLHYVKYDALDPLTARTKFDYVIHGAGNANPFKYMSEPVETMLGNIYGIREILEYARVFKSRVLYISSSEVYGNLCGNKPFKENEYGAIDISNVRACYPSSKRAAESLCISYYHEYGVSVVIARPGHVYGPTASLDDNRASSVFPRYILEGKDIVMKSKGNQMRSYCYVVDCASAVLTVLLNGESGDAYNISCKKSVVSVKEMAESFAAAGEKRVVYEPPTEREKEGYNLMSNSSLDSGKIEKLGWHGLFDMKIGAQHTIEALRSMKF